ncbi:MAG: hypothetical protein GY757_46175, partial [bacterium]|nr:hypothetical protein [bacterium]
MKQNRYIRQKRVIAFVALLFSFTVSICGQVNYNGSFSTEISIAIPAGINNTAPVLALLYNSDAKNGLVGAGWELSGFPAITRMNRGQKINYDQNDAFLSRDGVLVNIGNFKYHSEYDANCKYVPFDSSGSPASSGNPSYWEAYDNAGNTLTYGFAVQRVDASGSPYSNQSRGWALSEFRDRFGNRYYITYEQDVSNGDYRPLTIRYTLNESVDSGYTITLSYEERPDKPVSYDVDSRVSAQKRLSRISVTHASAPETTIMVYDFEYRLSPKTLESRLTGFKKRKTDAFNVIDYYAFEWRDNLLETVTGADQNLADIVPSVLDWGADKPNSWQHGDFTGDGRQDLMVLGADDRWHVMASDKGNFTQIHSEPKDSLTPSVRYWGKDHPRSWIQGDFDGDSKSDFLFLDSAEFWNMRLSNGDGSFTAISLGARDAFTPHISNWGASKPNSWHVGDFNSDSRTDFMYLGSDSNWHVYLADGAGSFDVGAIPEKDLTDNVLDWGARIPNSWMTGDIDGNGTMDLMFLDQSNTWQIRLLNGHHFTAKSIARNDLTPNALDWIGLYPKTWIKGDFNADKKIDFMYLDKLDQWVINLAAEPGAWQRIIQPRSDLTPHVYEWGRNFPGAWQIDDFNSDGRTDFRFYQSSGSWLTQLSQGDGTFRSADAEDEFTSDDPLDWGRDIPNAWLRGDYTRDGRPDTISRPNADRWRSIITQPSKTLLTKITDTVGKVTCVEYRSIQDDVFADAIQENSLTCGETGGAGYERPCGVADAKSRFLVRRLTESNGHAG